MSNLIRIVCDADINAVMKARYGKSVREHAKLETVLKVYRQQQEDEKREGSRPK